MPHHRPCHPEAEGEGNPSILTNLTAYLLVLLLHMKKIFSYLHSYWQETDKIVWLTAAFITAVLVFINYYFGLNHYLNSLDELNSFAGWYLVFLFSFSSGYALIFTWTKQKRTFPLRFIFLLFLAPAIFAWKMVFEVDWNFSADEIRNAYLNRVIYWPFKLIIVTLILWLIWRSGKEKQPFYGLNAKDFSLRPYFIMLLIMVPLIALASTQPDFLHTYPKLKHISFLNTSSTGVYKLIYELSYGSDFFTIELFFRGFLVLAFSRWFGKDAILPMAMFYCTIHFGKPLGECISSFFGGMILGIVTYHTRTIYGGLMVHLGIAWMMELGGYWGNMHW